MSRVDGVKQVGPHDTAISKKRLFPSTFEGKVVSIVGNKLVMTNKEGKEISHTLAENVKLTCEGALCQAEDLKIGSDIRMITRQDERRSATRIDSYK